MENKEITTIFYGRKDLKIEEQKKKVKNIHIKDFIHCNNIFKYDLYIFVDDDFKTKILKSRFTDNGIVVNEDRKKNIFKTLLENFTK